LDSASTNIADSGFEERNVGSFDYIRLYNPKTSVRNAQGQHQQLHIPEKEIMPRASSSKSASSSKPMRISIKEMRLYDGNMSHTKMKRSAGRI
jgi:hypothetical protein